MKYGLIKDRVADLNNIETPKGMTAPEAKYALNILQGLHPREAYKDAVGNRANGKTNDQLAKAAYKFKTSPKVQRYIKALMEELERVAVANSLDLQMFLTAAIFTPIGAIDEHHPLCQKKKTTIRKVKDSEDEIESIDLEMVSKLDAAKMLIRMKGLDAPIKIDHNHRVGVMVVPMAASVEDWEKLAGGPQKELMADAVNID